MRRVIGFAGGLLAVMLAGCSESPPAPAKKEAAAEPVAGQFALYKMYQKARASWSADAQVLSLNSIHLPEVPQPRGKAGAWQAVFTSEQLGRSRTFTYSVVESSGNLHQGVFAGPEESWSGKGALGSTPFPIGAVKIETDAAYTTALTQAFEQEKKNPGMTISWVLEKTPKYPDPAWRVVWGESVGTSTFSVFVDASTGDILGLMH